MEKKTTKENEETKKELRNDQGQTIFISYLIRHHVESIMPKKMQIFIFFSVLSLNWPRRTFLASPK
jgi:hypothetical protein